MQLQLDGELDRKGPVSELSFIHLQDTFCCVPVRHQVKNTLEELRPTLNPLFPSLVTEVRLHFGWKC